MQAAMGIVPLNKRELLPPGRKLWRPPGWVWLLYRTGTCIGCFLLEDGFLYPAVAVQWGNQRFLKKKQFGGHADNSIVSSFPSKKEGEGILFHSHSTETVFQLLTIILKGRNLWGKYINIVTIWATSCHEEGGGIGQVDCKHNAWHILLTTERHSDVMWKVIFF